MMVKSMLKSYYTFTVCLLVLTVLIFVTGCSSNEKSMVDAVKNGDIVKVQSLLDKGVDPNLKTDDGKTLLMLAVYLGHFDISALLIEKGADVNAQDNDGKTALMIAAEKGDIEMAKLLLENGADINAVDKNGKTALKVAEEKSDNALKMVEFLKNWNQSPNPAATAENPASSTDEPIVVEPSPSPAADNEETDMSPSEEAGLEESDNRPLSSIYFDFDKAVLRTDQAKTMEENLEIAKENTDMVLILGGHADERGTKEYNQALSERRAKAVQQYLVSHGVDPDNVIVYGFGKDHPRETGHNEEAWKENRRVDIFLWDRKLTKDEVVDETTKP